MRFRETLNVATFCYTQPFIVNINCRNWIRCVSVSIELRDIMVGKVINVDAGASLKEVVTLMNRYEIGSVIICKNQLPVGIVTERDLLKRVLANVPELEHIKVEQIMSKPVVTGKPDMELEQAITLMIEHKIKKLPIVDDQKLLGLVSLTDILRFQPQLIRVYKIFSSDVVPARLRKVFDYYLLLSPESKGLPKENLPFQLPKK